MRLKLKSSQHISVPSLVLALIVAISKGGYCLFTRILEIYCAVILSIVTVLANPSDVESGIYHNLASSHLLVEQSGFKEPLYLLFSHTKQTDSLQYPNSRMTFSFLTEHSRAGSAIIHLPSTSILKTLHRTPLSTSLTPNRLTVY